MHTAVIVGAGRIAAGFDTRKARKVLTHAHGYSVHPRIVLRGLYDVDSRRVIAASQAWAATSYGTLERMLDEVKPEIISICTPDAAHADSLRRVLPYGPKLVICEKPLTLCLEDSLKIAAAYRRARIPILVNYSRRFDPDTQQLRVDLRKGTYGKILSAVGIYTKGLLHNGSHMIDWARFLFGEIKSLRALGGRVDDVGAGKSVSGFLSFQWCPEFHLAVGDARRYSVFELEIICEKGRIRLLDAGFFIEQQALAPDRRYPGYMILGKPSLKKTRLDEAIPRMFDNAVAHLDRQAPLLCTAADAIRTQEVCSQLLAN